ncbi:hypothetical protein [Novipirellula rosea]|uniref:hypothetical protein n=1 Tax=Novipirellula rosea TaxID=1031540 RepID=UPI0031E87324
MTLGQSWLAAALSLPGFADRANADSTTPQYVCSIYRDIAICQSIESWWNDRLGRHDADRDISHTATVNAQVAAERQGAERRGREGEGEGGEGEGGEGGEGEGGEEPLR